MDEKKEIEEDKAKEPTGNTDEGGESETDSLLKRAGAAAERLEEANKKAEINIRRQEELRAKQVLSGRADHLEKEKKTEKPTEREIAAKVLKGNFNPFRADGLV